MKKLFLVTAILASIMLVGCGGGSHSSSSSPLAPVVNNPNEVIAARTVVAPIVSNARTILGLPAQSNRLSSSDNNSITFEETTKNINTVFKTPVIIQSLLRATGSDIEVSGQFEKQADHEVVSSFENGIYERKVYTNVTTSKNNPNNYLAYYRIDNCVGNLDNDGILSSLTIKDNASISVDDKEAGVSFKGKITTDFKVLAVPSVTTSNAVVGYDGQSITSGEGYQYSKMINITNMYTISALNLILDSLEIKNNYDYKAQTYDGIIKGTNVQIGISGLNNSTVTETKTIYCGGQYVKWENNKWVKNTNNDYSSKLIIDKSRTDNINPKTPVLLSVNGNFTNTTNNKKSDTAEINNISIKISTLTKDTSKFGYRVDKAEAHIELGSVSSSEKFKVGDKEFALSSAKIDISNIKYDEAWESLSDSEKNLNIFGNSIVKINAVESKNNVQIKDLKYYIADNEIAGTIINNGSSIVKDKDLLLQFDFDTVEISGTNVKLVELNSFEGAIFDINATEKDGTKSSRSYTVTNNKFVLKKSNDKQNVIIPDGVHDNSSEIIDSVDAGKLIASGNDSKLKIGDGDDGTRLAIYSQEASGDNKKYETKAMAKENVICAVSYYYDENNKIYTVLFAYDNEKTKIKGIIFSGEQISVKFNTVKNRIGTFSGIDNGNIKVLTTDGNVYTVKL